MRIIDRDPELAAAIAAILRDAGLATIACPDERFACELLVVGLPAPRDVSRRLDPVAPVVLMRTSGVAYGVVEEWVVDRPGFAILEKPVSPAALVHVARTLLAAVRGVAPEAKEP